MIPPMPEDIGVISDGQSSTRERSGRAAKEGTSNGPLHIARRPTTAVW